MSQLSTLSVIEFSGTDAGQFLHNQLSSDIAGIVPGKSGFACCCNPAGRVIALMLIYRTDDTFMAVCSNELASELVTWLSRFIIRAAVTIHLRNDLAVFSLDKDEPLQKRFLVKILTALGVNYSISETGSESDSVVNNQTWKSKELDKGIVWLDSTTSTKFLPQMLGYERIGALSFNKGCYPGQEIIARTRYLGKLKRRPVLLKVAGNPEIENGGKLNLRCGDQTVSAVVVDQSTCDGDEHLLFIVARSEGDFAAEQVVIQEKEYPVIGT